MSMKIPELNSIQMMRTDSQHFGNGKITAVTAKRNGFEAVTSVTGVNRGSEAASVSKSEGVSGKSFQDFLLEAVNSVNNSQLDVSNLQEKLITNPDDVDIHDVTIAMSKARMSLNLAQNVIDRLTSSWNEITSTR